MNAQPETFEPDAPDDQWRADAPALDLSEQWLAVEAADARQREWLAQREAERACVACFI